MDQGRSKIQISAKPGYAYGLQLVTVPPWFPIEVGVVMSMVLPTHLGPSAFCGVSVAVVTGLPTRWGPSAPAAASVSGISSVGLVGLFASIVMSCVCTWLTKYMAQALPPRETPQNLRNQVGAPTWCGAKRKRKAEDATADPIDPGQWLQDARNAGDSEAVAWFVARATNTGADDHIKKRQRLNVDTQRWEQYKTTTDRLANEHAQQARDIYHKAHLEAMARQHLRTLHMGYTNALTAKTDYHRLVVKLVNQQRQTQRLHDTHAHLYQIRRQWYEQAKEDTRLWYTDAKLLLMVNDRYWRLSAGTAKLLDLHHQQATYMWQQQTHLTAMAQYYQDACTQFLHFVPGGGGGGHEHFWGIGSFVHVYSQFVGIHFLNPDEATHHPPPNKTANNHCVRRGYGRVE